jgi:hypothetical protein
MVNDPTLFLRSADHIRNHPDSVARRLRARGLRAAYARLGTLSATEQRGHVDCFDDDHWEPAEIHPRGEAWLHSRKGEFRPCPLGQVWFVWNMLNFSLITDEDRRRCSAARRPCTLEHRERLKLQWRVAEDATAVRSRPEHFHAETSVDTHAVHIDCVRRRLYGPGGALNECRIFVDGRLEGRGGYVGCSLGFGGEDLPATARIGRSTLVSVDLIPDIAIPVVELWRVSERRCSR